jgi:hypothetical protein
LQPQLHDGDTTNSLIARFGPPEYQHETGTHELSMGFFFLDDNHAALAALPHFLPTINWCIGIQFTTAEISAP